MTTIPQEKRFHKPLTQDEKDRKTLNKAEKACEEGRGTRKTMQRAMRCAKSLDERGASLGRRYLKDWTRVSSYTARSSRKVFAIRRGSRCIATF